MSQVCRVSTSQLYSSVLHLTYDLYTMLQHSNMQLVLIKLVSMPAYQWRQSPMEHKANMSFVQEEPGIRYSRPDIIIMTCPLVSMITHCCSVSVVIHTHAVFIQGHPFTRKPGVPGSIIGSCGSRAGKKHAEECRMSPMNVNLAVL